jgi:hypothetical protein
MPSGSFRARMESEPVTQKLIIIINCSVNTSLSMRNYGHPLAQGCAFRFSRSST